MINNPSAVTRCSTLMPLKQQVSAAEIDNSEECKGASGDLNHQRATTFSASMTNIFFVFVSSCVTSYFSSNIQLPATMLFPFLLQS